MAEGERRELGGGDFDVRGRIKRRKAVLVYNENAERILVVTVMWSD